MNVQVTPTDHRFRHEALFYNSPESFLAGTVPFLREGVRNGEAVLVVESAAKIQALKSALGSEAAGVLFADMAGVGANPARIIPAWQDFVDSFSGTGRSMRGIGEPIWKERTPEELIECQRHESLLNVAFADGEPWYLLCPYDTAALPSDVIEEARRSHALLSDGHAHVESPVFRGVEESGAPFDTPLPEPQAAFSRLEFGLRDLKVVRDMAGAHAESFGLSASRARGFVIAVNEIATNSVGHGGGRGVMRIWQEANQLTCEIADAGRFNLPLADRMRPAADSSGARGLWLANQLCDLVQIRSVPQGSIVRLHMREPAGR